ncbi:MULTISPECIES: DUF4421 family protein [Flammeovirga]|uniref:DUF4421 domain-containing protein n=1 Tax=Flammeovirga agarivorans TaxID=2726742 RepID=A0A7X8SLA8_9BACT|nr:MULTISPECIES: DUF4421 family protein [Flammeovirga]NLR92217.1 DUF4421 domain-containing protein [Flammeovirga agarivorans]
MKGFITLLFLVLFCSPITTYAQEEEEIKLDHDTTYYKSFNDMLHLRLYTVYKFNELVVNSGKRISSHDNLVYAPNGNLNLGFGFNYKGLGINFGFNFPAINNDDDVYGETNKLDMRSYLYARKFAVDLGLQFYKGFYISEVNENDPIRDPQPPTQLRGDMVINTFGLSSFWIHNYEKFSFRAAFAQTEVQKKTSGSLLYGPYLNFVRIKADSSLVPENLREEYLLSSNIISGWYGSMGLSAGYAQSVILFKRFFITGSLALGYGITFGHYFFETDYGNEKDTIWKGGLKYNARLAFGYNTDRMYVGSSLVLESYNITTASDNVTLYWMGQFRVNLVHRFNWKVGILDWALDKEKKILSKKDK